MPRELPAKLLTVSEACAIAHKHGLSRLEIRADGFTLEFLPDAHRKPGGEVGAEFGEEPEPKGPSDKLLYQASG